MINNWSTFLPKWNHNQSWKKWQYSLHWNIYQNWTQTYSLKGFFLQQNFRLVIPFSPQCNSVLVLIQHIHTTNKIALFSFTYLSVNFCSKGLMWPSIICLTLTNCGISAFCGQTSELLIPSPILTQLKTYDFSDCAKTDGVRKLSFTS